jgi:hypothetical protein
MKITPDIFRTIAEHLKTASEASAKISQILSALAVEPPQTELPLTGNSGSTTILTCPKELSEAAKAALASINVPVSAQAIEAIAQKLYPEFAKVKMGVDPDPIVYSAEYLASKRACVEVAPEAPKAPEITRQSLRALAEKLVAKGRLPDVKAALAKFGVTTLSALKPENYAAVQADFIKNGAS